MKVLDKISHLEIALIGTVLIAGCSSGGDGILDRFLKGSSGTVPVTVENVIVTEKTYEIKVPATLAPASETTVSLPEEVTIRRTIAAKGDRVAEGDALFQIAETKTSSLLEKYRTDLRDAKAEVEKNSYLMRNRDRLLDEGKIDQDMYDKLDVEYEAGEAKVEKLQAEVTRLKDQTGDLSIASPTDGVVSNMFASVGMTIPAGKPLATITKTDSMTAIFELASYEAPAVRPGMPVMVRFPDLGGEAIKGAISNIDSSLDPANQTFRVFASIPNTKGFLKVGMTAEVQFMSNQKQRFYLIPTAALIKDKRRNFVFTVLDGAAHKVEVVTKEKQGNYIEIAKGLRENDLVVVKGNDKLIEGAMVDIWGR